MKCNNCGKNEVSCYYSSNINGNVTEKHLCAQCAHELGLDGAGFTDSIFSAMDDMFAGIMPGFGLMPRRRARYTPFTLLPVEIHLHAPSPSADTEKSQQQVQEDKELSMRRRLNELRYSMREAAMQEDFEKAAQLRDEIKAIEAAGGDTDGGVQPQA